MYARVNCNTKGYAPFFPEREYALEKMGSSCKSMASQMAFATQVLQLLQNPHAKVLKTWVQGRRVCVLFDVPPRPTKPR